MSALAGCRVVEAASMILAPTAAAIMTDFGADVVKVEPTEGGDQNRYLHELANVPRCPIPYSYLVDNRSKRGVALDLKHADGLAVLHRLVRTADVFLTNYRPQALERLRLRHDDLAPLNPGLICASATGLGEAGEEANRPACDTVVWRSRSGIEEALLPLEGSPPRRPPGVGDHCTALRLFGAVMLGLLGRASTGRGTRVSTSLLAAGAWANATWLQAALCGGTFLPGARPGISGLHCWTRDGRVAIFDRAFAEADAAEWQRRLTEHDVVFAILATAPEAVRDAQMGANDVFLPLEHPRWGPLATVNSPFTVGDAPKVAPRPAPELGEHTGEALAELGYAAGEIRDLLARGVAAQPPAALGTALRAPGRASSP